MTQKKRPMVDEKAYELAEYFLVDVPEATEDDIWALAKDLQTACEDACMEIKDRPKGIDR